MEKYVIQKVVLLIILVVLINLRELVLLILVETNYRVSPCTGVNKIKG